MTPKRIAYVLNIFPKLSETFIAGELAELRRRGVELRILSLLPPRNELQHQMIQRDGLDQLVEYDATKFLAVLREFQPELIHAHFAKEATEKAWELSRMTGVPFTFTAHGYDIHRKPPPDFQARARAARAVVTVSKANADYIQHTYHVPRDHIHVIPCGVDTELFRPPENRLSLPGEVENPAGSKGSPSEVGLCVLCVARHVAVKNLGFLLEACWLLHMLGLDFRCVLIGDGQLHGELKARRDKLGLQQIVELPGAMEQDAVRRWWHRAAVAVLTSENEGMPVCLMEAAACGVPMVAPAVGGIPELVRDGQTGLLTKPGELRSFVRALERLLLEPKLRARLGAAARQDAETRFSIVRQVDSLLALWEQVLTGPKQTRRSGFLPLAASGKAAGPDAANGTASTIDPFGPLGDRGLPTLSLALDFETARHEVKRRLPRLSGQGKLRLKAIRLVRHKPERRAVVEYEVEVNRPDAPRDRATLIGKLRARRSGNEGFRQLAMFWNAGFDAQSGDGISVPEPIGVISAFQMWFQRKVPGVTAEEVFSKAPAPERVALARRVAEAIHKVHNSGVPAAKSHTMADELRILRECFDKLVALKPEWAARIAGLSDACDKLGAGLSKGNTCGIHRDFYPAQVLADGTRLWLIDFDLYCLGDPGLDVGNFLGHVSEQALRECGDVQGLADVENALEERFVALSGEGVRASVHAYTTLTLARHIYLSTRFPERRSLTEALLALCEKRLRLT